MQVDWLPRQAQSGSLPSVAEALRRQGKVNMQDQVVNQSPVDLAPLIPRELLFGNPERANPKLSPDGKYLAYIAPDSNNVLQVWLRTVGQQDDRVLTADKKRGIRAYFWTYDGEQLIYLQDSDGDENWHLYGVNIQSLAMRDLTPFPGVQAQLVALEPNFPDLALIGLNQIDPRKHDVYSLNLKTAAIEFNTENPGNVMGWSADAQFQVRSATAATPDGGWDLLVRDRTSPGKQCATGDRRTRAVQLAFPSMAKSSIS